MDESNNEEVMNEINNEIIKDEHIDEMENRKYISLAPRDDLEKTEYDKILSEVLEDCSSNDNGSKRLKKNKNIAVTGTFGAGKSSVVRSFMNNNESYKNTVLYVTLGSYNKDVLSNNNDNNTTIIAVNNNDDNSNNNNNLSDKELSFNNVENSILQQIIYKERPHRFPYSRVKRIDKDSDVIKNTINFISIGLTFILFLFFLNKFSVPFFCTDSNYFLYYPLNLIGYMFVFFTLYFLVKYFIGFIIDKGNISSFDFKGYQISIDEHTDSLLNKNIDEIIHFFLETDYSFIVFEDLDRLSNRNDIFNKLKEINHILNVAIENVKNKRTIQFIYMLNDSVFSESEERTKFFDVIIPIVPYSNFGTVMSIFNGKRDILYGVEDIDFRKISRFITNSRQANQIINEYRIFSDALKDRGFIGKDLFYMISYKVLFPNRFELLFLNKGILSYYISGELELDYRKHKRDKKLQDLKDQLDKNNKLQEELNNKKKELLKNKFDVSEFQLISFFNDSKYICNVHDIFNDCNSIFDLNVNNLVLFDENQEQVSEENFFGCKKSDFFSEINNSIYNQQIQYLQSRLEDLKFENLYIEHLDYTEVCDFIRQLELKSESKYYDKDKCNKINFFESLLFDEKIIKKHTLSLFSKNTETYYSDNDEKIFTSLGNGEYIAYEQTFDDIDKVFNDININSYYSDVYNIKALYCKIFELNFYEILNYLKASFSNLSEKKLLFYKKLYNDGIDVFSKEIFPFRDFFESKFYDLDDNTKDFYIYVAIKYMHTNDVYLNNILYNNFKSSSSILYFLNKKKDYLTRLDKLPELKISQNNLFDESCINVLSIFYSEGLIIRDFNLMSDISRIISVPFSISYILESASLCGQGSVFYKYVYDNLDSSINDILSLNIKQSDSEYFLINFFKDLKVDNIDKVLSFEKVKFEDLNDISEECYNSILKYDCFKPNWKNVNTLFNSNVQDSFNIDEYLTDNIDVLLIDNTFDVNRFSSLRSYILSDSSLVDNVFNKYASKIIETRFFTKISNPDNLIRLIDLNKVWLKDQELLDEFTSREDIPYEYKITCLINCLDDVLNKNLIIPEGILISLLNNEKSNKVMLIDYIFNNNSIINNGNIRDNLFNLLCNVDCDLEISKLIHVLELFETDLEKIKIFNKQYKKKFDHKLLSLLENSTGVLNDLFNHIDISLSITKNNEYFLNLIKGVLIEDYIRLKTVLKVVYKS